MTAALVPTAVAPRLVVTFIEQTLQPGPPLSLRCAASGSPPPRITWLLDGGELRPGDGEGEGGALYQQAQHQDQRGEVLGSLNMSSVRVQHGGVYTCVARNMMGSAHHTAALNVYGEQRRTFTGPLGHWATGPRTEYAHMRSAHFGGNSVTRFDHCSLQTFVIFFLL